MQNIFIAPAMQHGCRAKPLFQLKFLSIDTPRDFVEDTYFTGKLLMVGDGLADK